MSIARAAIKLGQRALSKALSKGSTTGTQGQAMRDEVNTLAKPKPSLRSNASQAKRTEGLKTAAKEDRKVAEYESMTGKTVRSGRRVKNEVPANSALSAGNTVNHRRSLSENVQIEEKGLLTRD